MMTTETDDFLTVAEAAALIQGNEYREEVSRELKRRLAKSRLVAVYGASDDLVELEGYINDEYYLGEQIPLWSGGKSAPKNRCEETECPYFHDLLKSASYYIEGVWDADPDWVWTFKTNIPNIVHFDIYEDSEPFCRGFVFSIDDLK